jgi:hypothetical protein
MAYVDYPIGIYYPSFPVGWGNAVNRTLDSANERWAFIFRAPKTGTLDRFEAAITVSTFNAASRIRFSFQDIDSNGVPDGIADQYRIFAMSAGTAQWIVPPGPMTSDGTDLGTKRSVTRGDWVACVIDYNVFTSGDSIIVLCDTVGTDSIAKDGYYVADDLTGGGTWSRLTSGKPRLALRYVNDDYPVVVPGIVLPHKASGVVHVESGTTPDEFGNRFVLPFACKVSGVWAYWDQEGSTGTGTFKIYDSSNNVIASYDVESAKTASQGSGTIDYPTMFLFNSDVELAANTLYRIVLEGTHASIGYDLLYYDVDRNEILSQGLSGDRTCYATQRTDGGSWTDMNTRQAFMGVVISAIDIGASGLLGGSLLNRGLN